MTKLWPSTKTAIEMLGALLRSGTAIDPQMHWKIGADVHGDLFMNQLALSRDDQEIQYFIGLPLLLDEAMAKDEIHLMRGEEKLSGARMGDEPTPTHPVSESEALPI